AGSYSAAWPAWMVVAANIGGTNDAARAYGSRLDVTRGKHIARMAGSYSAASFGIAIPSQLQERPLAATGAARSVRAQCGSGTKPEGNACGRGRCGRGQCCGTTPIAARLA